MKNIYIPEEERVRALVQAQAQGDDLRARADAALLKDQILEWYLNQISYGGLYNGVEAASQGYFGKHAKDLTLPEAALLAGIPA